MGWYSCVVHRNIYLGSCIIIPLDFNPIKFNKIVASLKVTELQKKFCFFNLFEIS